MTIKNKTPETRVLMDLKRNWLDFCIKSLQRKTINNVQLFN